MGRDAHRPTRRCLDEESRLNSGMPLRSRGRFLSIQTEKIPYRKPVEDGVSSSKSAGLSYDTDLTWRNQPNYLGLLGRANPQKNAPMGALGWCEEELNRSAPVMALVGSGVQGEPVATSPIGRKLFASIAFGVGLRDVSAQVQGVGVALHDSASSRAAYAVFVAPQRLKCSFSWSWLRRDESEIHEDSRNRRHPYRRDKRPV